MPGVAQRHGDARQNFAPLADPVRRNARAVMLIGRDAPRLREALAETGIHLDIISAEEEARLALGRLNRNEVVIFPAPPAGR